MSEKRRVLILVENLPSPFDRRVWQEATTLHANGYGVSIICPTGKGYEKHYEEIDGIHIYRYDLLMEAEGAKGYAIEYSAALWHTFRLAWKVKREQGFDVVHACNPPDLLFLIGGFFKLFSGKKFLFDHHDINPELYEAKFGRRDFFWKLMVWLERMTFKTADVSIATNESYKKIAIERGGMNPDKVYVVRSGPKLDRLKIIPPVPSLKHGRQYLVGYVGVMGKQEGIDRSRTLFASGRIRRLRFTNRPPVTPSTFYQYHDVNHLLGSLALIQSRYYRTNLLYNFGRTEDIPYGFLARVTYGLADEEFLRSTYASTTLAAGDRIGGLGYCVGEARVGGTPKAGKLTQGVLRMRTRYFSNLLHAGRFRFRQFINAAYVTGIHRSTDDSIDFSGEQGIRGVAYNSSVIGTKRLQLNLETVAFTPWRVRGVACAFFTFADLDVIAQLDRLADDIGLDTMNTGVALAVAMDAVAIPRGPARVEFDHVEFSYPARSEVSLASLEAVGLPETAGLEAPGLFP